MKKAAIGILAAWVLFCLAACSSQKGAVTGNGDAQTSSQEVQAESSQTSSHKATATDDASQGTQASPPHANFQETASTGGDSSQAASQNMQETPSQEAESDVDSQQPEPEPSGSWEDEIVTEMEMIVGSTVFRVQLYDNETARALTNRLPITLDMRELNGNEKYHYFSESLPANPTRPGSIHTGDIMLYGSDCLVVFYEGFSTSYSYTPIGYVENPEGLAQAVGSSNVSITFCLLA